MDGVFGPIILGVFIIVIGINNMRGNINSIHSYHRRRVSEEDRLPFGRLMGLGTIFCGVGVILLGLMTLLEQQTGTPLFAALGSALAIVGLAVGLGLSFYAMIKYNKGIF